MKNQSISGWLRHADFMIVDLLCLQIAYICAYFIRFGFDGFPYFIVEYRMLILILSLVQISCSIIFGNLENVYRRGKADELWSVLVLSILTFLLASFYMFAAHNGKDYSRLQFFYSFIIFIFVDYFARIVFKQLSVKHLHRNPAKRKIRSIVLVSDDKNVQSIVEELKNDVYDYFKINGIILLDGLEAPYNIPLIPSLDDALKFICHEWVDEVIISLSNDTNTPQLFIDSCLEMGVTVHSIIPISTKGRNIQYIDEIGNYATLSYSLNHTTYVQAFFKRLFDILFSVFGCMVTIVIGIIIAPFILIKSPGNLIFSQVRIGKNGKKFKLLKFRSMVPNAEEKKNELEKQNRNDDGLMFKLDFDPRVIGNHIDKNGKKRTGIGEFIRKTSIDEFPQFFNVLKGDMSLVGTRPPLEDEWDKYQFHHRARLSMKPGMTGLWQVSGRSEITDFEEIVKLDTEYIANYKLSLDIKILLKTFVVLFSKKGAL